MDNLSIYERVRSVPQEAQKTIKGGRLSGMTDINPMWRIKTLTELFGAAGAGWWTENVKSTTYNGPNGEIAIMVELDLFYKTESGVSRPLHGVGGSMLIASESKGLRLDDEALKKAYTDALSVACKALGVGADIYWSKDSTKYSAPQTAQNASVTPPQAAQPQPYQAAQTILCEKCGKPIQGYRSRDGKQVTPETIKAYSLRVHRGCYCMACQKTLQRAAR